MARANVVRRVADWLREGYPTGVPEQDHVALLALLRRKLSEEELEEVVDRIILLHPVGNVPQAVVGQQIGALLDQQPHDDDIARVSSRLAAVGWPLAEVDD